MVFCNLTSDDLALIANDRVALVALYNATSGSSWNTNRNWLGDAPLGQWHGVITDNNGRVAALNLSDNLLVGEIPAKLGELTNLGGLYLNDNALSGTIPVELGGLANLLELNLSDNKLTGGIPLELGNLANLGSLYLHNNRLTGEIPVALGYIANLQNLYLHGNRLTGCVPQWLNYVPYNDFNSLSIPFCGP